MKKNLLIPFIIGNLLLIATLHGFSQTGINTDGTPPDPSAGLDVKFPNKGLLPPRMTNEQMNAIPNPVSGLCVFCSDCGPSGTGALAMFMNGGWYAISMSCAVPASPAAAANTPDLTRITWNWNTVAGAAGYKWNTTNSYATATDMGTLTSKTETGLTCSTAYTRYAWAYNACGNSQPVTLSQSTMVCWSCGLVFTDPRDGKNYNTVTIGTQCWMTQNLNVGLRVNANVLQTNNSIIEKYCTGDLEANCYTYGGLYLWDELMQYSTANGSQGICPEGWHIPTDGEYATIITLLGGSGNAGGPMKEAGTVHWAAPNTGATNSSGFTALPGGDRNTGLTYTNLTTIGFYWTSTMIDAGNASIRMFYNNFSGAYSANGARSSGLSVRCIHN